MSSTSSSCTCYLQHAEGFETMSPHANPDCYHIILGMSFHLPCFCRWRLIPPQPLSELPVTWWSYLLSLCS